MAIPNELAEMIDGNAGALDLKWQRDRVRACIEHLSVLVLGLHDLAEVDQGFGLGRP